VKVNRSESGEARRQKPSPGAAGLPPPVGEADGGGGTWQPNRVLAPRGVPARPHLCLLPATPPAPRSSPESPQRTRPCHGDANLAQATIAAWHTEIENYNSVRKHISNIVLRKFQSFVTALFGALKKKNETHKDDSSYMLSCSPGILIICLAILVLLISRRLLIFPCLSCAQPPGQPNYSQDPA